MGHFDLMVKKVAWMSFWWTTQGLIPEGFVFLSSHRSLHGWWAYLPSLAEFVFIEWLGMWTSDSGIYVEGLVHYLCAGPNPF